MVYRLETIYPGHYRYVLCPSSEFLLDLFLYLGSTAAFIIMMLPPSSGRKAVRHRNASVITGLGNLYSFLMSTWLSDAPLSNKAVEPESDSSTTIDDNRDTQKQLDAEATPALSQPDLSHPIHSVRWLDKFRVRLLSLSDELNALKQLTMTATWEGSIRGKWPAEEYTALLDAEGEMLIGLALVGDVLKWDCFSNATNYCSSEAHWRI